MLRTTNLNLKKPEENEYINIQDLNENFDELDKLGAPEFDDTGTVTGVTDKTSLLASLVSKMPLVQFLRNVKAGFQMVLYAGQIVNNCVTDNSNLPLSASQGKVLMDFYNALNTNLTQKEYSPAIAWNSKILEQSCIKIGKICCVTVRGSVLDGESYLFQNQALFSIPWEPEHGYLDMEAPMVIWDVGAKNCRPVQIAYDPSYRTISITSSVGAAHDYSFTYCYICK